MPLFLGEGSGPSWPPSPSPNASYFGEIFTCGPAWLRLFGSRYRHLKDDIGSLIRVSGEWFA